MKALSIGGTNIGSLNNHEIRENGAFPGIEDIRRQANDGMEKYVNTKKNSGNANALLPTPPTHNSIVSLRRKSIEKKQVSSAGIVVAARNEVCLSDGVVNDVTPIPPSDVNCPKPKSMTRAKSWTPQVENAYRYQLAGFRDEEDYKSLFTATPEVWPETGFISKIKLYSY
eukprot:gene44720-59699_t